MVTGVLDALDHSAIGSERVASSICWHAYRRARHHLGLNRPAPLSLDGMAIPLEAPPSSVSATPEEVLVVAVRAGVIAAADAELLASKRLDGRSLDELAPDFEMPFHWGPPQPGERVVDLGSGAGMDSMLAGLWVGSEGRVIGVDVTAEMLGCSRRVAAQLGFGNVEFREGLIESVPVDDGWGDVVISNGVINLCPDKLGV